MERLASRHSHSPHTHLTIILVINLAFCIFFQTFYYNFGNITPDELFDKIVKFEVQNVTSSIILYVF